MLIRQHVMSARVSTSGPDHAGVRRVYVDGVELVSVTALAPGPDDDEGPTFAVSLSRCPCAPPSHHAGLMAAMCAALDKAQLYV